MVEAAGVELITILITRKLLILGTATTAKKAPLPDPLYVYCTKIPSLNGSASLRKTGCQGVLLRGEVLFIEVDAKALNPVKTTSIHNAARMVESCATNPIRGGPARKPT